MGGTLLMLSIFSMISKYLLDPDWSVALLIDAIITPTEFGKTVLFEIIFIRSITIQGKISSTISIAPHLSC